jgi:hypothetical protein
LYSPAHQLRAYFAQGESTLIFGYFPVRRSPGFATGGQKGISNKNLANFKILSRGKFHYN